MRDAKVVERRLLCEQMIIGKKAQQLREAAMGISDGVWDDIL